MAIEDILRTLDEQAQVDIDAVLSEAKAHAELIEQEARDEAAKIARGFADTAQRHAESEAARRVNAARLEAKMIVSSARAAGLNAVFTGVDSELAKLRGTAEYPALFAALASEALEGLYGDVVVRVDPADEALARKLSVEGGSVSVVTDAPGLGGLVVEANAGRVIRRNTLSDRAERARQYVQADVARTLFG